MRLPIAVLACLAAALPAAAQDDAENSNDHPMFSRMPGYYIEGYAEQDFRRLSSTTSTRPVADNAADAGRAQNRRVELVKR